MTVEYCKNHPSQFNLSLHNFNGKTLILINLYLINSVKYIISNELKLKTLRTFIIR